MTIGLPNASQRILLCTTQAVTVRAFLVPVVEYWVDRGHSVVVGCCDAASLSGVLPASVETVELPWAPTARRPFAAIEAAAIFRRLLTRSQFDVVNVHTPVAALVSRWVASTTRFRRNGGRVVYTVHGFHFSPNGFCLFNAFARAVETVTARVTDRIITINSHDFRAASKMLRGSADTVLSRGVGVDLSDYRPGTSCERETVRNELGFSEHDFVVGYVGELSANKRQIDLVRALADLPEHVKAVFVGEGGQRGAIESEASSLSVADRTLFLGQRSDVPMLLRGFDALALLSKREGLPKCVMEGLASGLPIIGTRTRGTEDLVESIDRTVPVADPSKIAEVVSLLIENEPDEAKREERRRRAAQYDVGSCSMILAEAVLS